MKKYTRVAAALMAAALLAGCAPRTMTPAATPTPQPPSSQSEASEPTPAPEAEPTPAGEPGLDYDEMRNVAVGDSTPKGVQEGYFTVSKDGKWGLIRANGTEVLPCRADVPVGRCNNEGHWTWTVPGMGWEEQDAISAELEAEGEPTLCPGHGAGMITFFYDLDAPGRDIHAYDPGALRAYTSSDGPGDIVELTDEMWETYGDPLPCYDANEEGEEGDPVYPSDPIVTDMGNGNQEIYFYADKAGNRRGVANIQLAGYFYDEQMAPIQNTDGKWSYIDREFGYGTEYVYDATYDALRDPDTGDWTAEPAYAAPMQNGYVAVRRGDKWGLINSVGDEVIPCEHPGVAWDGTTLWIKDATGWHQSELPA